MTDLEPGTTITFNAPFLISTKSFDTTKERPLFHNNRVIAMFKIESINNDHPRTEHEDGHCTITIRLTQVNSNLPGKWTELRNLGFTLDGRRVS